MFKNKWWILFLFSGGGGFDFGFDWVGFIYIVFYDIFIEVGNILCNFWLEW